jgi:transposase
LPSIALERGDVIVGVDTHKDEHVAYAINGLGGTLGEPGFFPANPVGYADMLSWAETLGAIHAFSVEGWGSYGSGLARFLRRNEHVVREVARPPRKGERRMSGKSDAIDAEHAARTVLSGSGTSTPKLADGQIEAIRLVKIARDTAVKAHSTAIITLKAVLVTASDELRADLEPLTNLKLAFACAELDTSGDIADPHVAIVNTLACLA